MKTPGKVLAEQVKKISESKVLLHSVSELADLVSRADTWDPPGFEPCHSAAGAPPSQDRRCLRNRMCWTLSVFYGHLRPSHGSRKKPFPCQRE